MTTRYDAFLSYSHAADGRFAPDFRRLKRLFTVTRGTYATMERPAILDVPMPDGRRLRVSVVLYDTKLLAPASAGSLKALGELLGFPKLEVPLVVDERGRTVAGITRMDIVARQHPDAFRAYAVRDAEIAVDWLLKVADFADAWGSSGCRGRWPRWASPDCAGTPRPNCRPSWAAM